MNTLAFVNFLLIKIFLTLIRQTFLPYGNQKHYKVFLCNMINSLHTYIAMHTMITAVHNYHDDFNYVYIYCTVQLITSDAI